METIKKTYEKIINMMNKMSILEMIIKMKTWKMKHEENYSNDEWRHAQIYVDLQNDANKLHDENHENEEIDEIEEHDETYEIGKNKH